MAQLDSLASQIKLPQELVACDDASEDATFEILADFAIHAPFPVRLYRNPQRLGIGANFERAIGLCSGEAIALCDQDDVWMPEKLARFAEAFAAGAEWVCCDARIVGEDLTPLGYTLWERVNFCRSGRDRARQGRLFEVLLKHCVVAGATLAFRAGLRDGLLPIPSEWHYDAWLAAVLAARSRGALIDEPMQYYRQHGGNALGGARRSLSSEVRAAFSLDRNNYYQEELGRWSQLAARLANTPNPGVEGELAAKLAHLKRRASLPPMRLARLPAVAVEMARGGYAHYARNWGSVAMDLLVK